MKAFSRMLPLLLLAGSMGFAAYELKKVSRLAAELKAGAPPEAVLRELAEDHKTGPLRFLLGQAGPSAKETPGASDGPISVVDTNSSSARVKEGPARRGAQPKPGGAILIDEATGRQYEIAGSPGPAPASKRAFALPPWPSLDGAARLKLSDDLESRKRRAYALLLGTAGAAVVFLIAARRRIKGM